MTEHLGIKKHWTELYLSFFGLECLVMWLDFVNLVTFVRGLFRKVVSLRYSGVEFLV